MLARMIPRTLIKNKIEALETIDQFSRTRPIAITERGGIKETEIATPGRVSLALGFTKEKVAAKPAIIETQK